MQESYYLPVGHVLGGHYEIVSVLGEDEFEILYLVKDTHRLETLFVIKEFFLKAYARRENVVVKVMAKSTLLFEESKKEMVEELTRAQKMGQTNHVQTFGYLEENNTIYTIMEFLNDSNIEHYLKSNNANTVSKSVEEKSEALATPFEEPVVEKRVELEEAEVQEDEKPKSYIFLKLLSLAVIIIAGLAYYSWEMIKADKEKAQEKKQTSMVSEREIYTPPLTNREEDEALSKEEAPKREELNTTVIKERPFNASYIEEGAQGIKQENDLKDDVFDIPNEEIYVDKEELKVAPREVVVQELPTVPTVEVKEIKPKVVKEPKIQESTVSLGTQIGGENRTENFNRMSVKRFLDSFIASSTNGSIEEIVSKYDTQIDRYFSAKNIDQNRVRSDKINYQKKWTKREFRLVGFKIIKTYRKGNFDYCDLSTTTQWNVSSDDFKTSTGRSRGFMTLKRTYNGFKVTSIYTVK